MPEKVRLEFNRYPEDDDPIRVVVTVTGNAGDSTMEHLVYWWNDVKREMVAANVFPESKMKHIDAAILQFGTSESEETDAPIEEVTQILRNVLHGVEISNIRRKK
jgi:hypothetical protein